MTEKDFRILLEKQRLGKLSPQEKYLLDTFENHLLSKNNQTVFENNQHRETVKKEIKSHVIKQNKSKFNYKFLAVAASIVLLFSIAFSYYFLNESSFNENQQMLAQKMLTMKTELGQKLNLTLPDGSKVRMNAGSTITFPEKFTDTIREIIFAGEAFFEVTKNKQQPFIIKTGSLTTRVLGTSFNINALKDNASVEVTLATGKVKVFTKNDSRELLPSEQAVFDTKEEKITTQKVNINNFIEWKEGVLRFENTTIGEAKTTLERWYNVKIELKNPELAECIFTGTFKNEALQTILESISFVKETIDFEFISKEKVIIKGRCN